MSHIFDEVVIKKMDINIDNSHIYLWHGIDFRLRNELYYDNNHKCEDKSCPHRLFKPHVLKYIRDKKLNSLLDG